jgi:hypothetical protein
MLSALYKSTAGLIAGSAPFFCNRFHNASTEHGVFLGFAPKARKAFLQASMCSSIHAGGVIVWLCEDEPEPT